MISAVFLLAALDFIILSASPDGTRLSIAIVVSLGVGIAIAMIWRRNVGLEKRAARVG